MTQLSLFTAQDKARLGKQLKKVRDFFEANRGTWFSLRQISDATGAPEASASARFRDLKKLGLPMERDDRGGGLHLYRMASGGES